MIKKILKYTGILILSAVIVLVTYMAVTFPPILAGTAAKTMCSCVYVMGRTPQSVVEKELTLLPGLDKAKFEFIDSVSVSATLLWQTSTAIYRKGIGCTLLAGQSEDVIRRQEPALPVPPPFLQDTVQWPMGDMLSGEPVAGVRYEGVESAIANAFEETDPEKPKRTLAVLVIYDGQIVGERYAEGFDEHSRFMGWSMTKSLTNGLIGVLTKEGKLTLDAPAPVSEWQSDERKNITLNNLMQASSGLEWNESYFTPGDFHNMFTHSDDKGGYAAARPLKYPIGTHWEYSSGTTNLLSKIIRETVGDANYPKFAYENFFYRIGMFHTIIEPDASGTFVGSSYGFASARDWARFGLLYLNDGVWNGERILPEGWVKYSSTPAPAAPIGEYGAQFWLNAGAKENPTTSYHPGIPNDEYGAEGFEQQNVFIIPSKKLVLVRLGISHHGFDMEGLTNQVIASLP
ncbi:MAG: serine hydrolase [Cyclobacteriaceae bacterium]|nr:serine hydrolase [Cyclobacteriaceae bacterium]